MEMKNVWESFFIWLKRRPPIGDFVQLVRAVFKRVLFTLIDVNEVREHAGVLLVGKNWENTHNG